MRTPDFGSRGADRLIYFAFDLLYLDEHDLRRCPIEERKTLLQQVLDEAGCERIMYVDHVIGRGAQLLSACGRSARRGPSRSGWGACTAGVSSRYWLKTKCHQTGDFVITGFEELGEGRLEAVYVVEEIAGKFVSAGQVRFGFAGKGLWSELDALRSGPARKGVVPVTPILHAKIKFFGRHKGGSIRDGVILSIDARAARGNAIWSCDSDEVIAAFQA